MRRVIRTGTCGLLAFWLSACATTRYEEYERTSGQGPVTLPVELKTPMATDSTAQAQVEMERRVAHLEQSLEDRLVALDMANADMVTQVMSFSEQLSEIRRQILALREPTGTPAGPPDVGPALTLNDVYTRALQQYSARQYAEARASFLQVLELSPTGDMADNAQYWLGECAYASKDFHGALIAFQKVFEFEHTEKDDDAQLKLGLCHLNLGEPQRALIELKRLVVDYPESEYIGRTNELIRKIRQDHPVAP
ncbi:MAG: tetratricopeptide repeat protein [bacterium]|nr:tetratricopeptide repeat protein [bacterium]